MNTQKSQTLMGRATAILSAIAASSLLGLPALAGGLSGNANKLGGQAQAPASPDQMQCLPTTQSSRPSGMVAPDASAPGAAQLPNQADPRTGTVPSDQTVSSRTDVSTADTSTVQTTQPSNTRSEGRTHGDVLAQGGATAGGFASQQVAAANNPEAYKMASSRYSSNELRTNNANGGTAMMRNASAARNADDSMRSNTMSQPSNQSSQTTTDMTIAQCPSEMMPRSSMPESR